MLLIPAFFLLCPQLGGSVITHNGRRDVCAKVLLDTETFGSVVTSNGENTLPEVHYLEVSNRELRRLDIKLVDKDMQQIEFSGGLALSFTISFIKGNDDE